MRHYTASHIFKILTFVEFLVHHIEQFVIVAFNFISVGSPTESFWNFCYWKTKQNELVLHFEYEWDMKGSGTTYQEDHFRCIQCVFPTETTLAPFSLFSHQLVEMFVMDSLQFSIYINISLPIEKVNRALRTSFWISRHHFILQTIRFYITLHWNLVRHNYIRFGSEKECWHGCVQQTTAATIPWVFVKVSSAHA